MSHTNTPPDTPTCWRQAPNLGPCHLLPSVDTSRQASSNQVRTAASSKGLPPGAADADAPSSSPAPDAAAHSITRPPALVPGTHCLLPGHGSTTPAFPFPTSHPRRQGCPHPPLYSWHGRWPRWGSQPQCRDILGWMSLTSEGSPCSVGCSAASLTPIHGQPRLSADIAGRPLEAELSWLSPPAQRMKEAAPSREGTPEPSQAPRMLLPGLERRSWGPVYPCRGRGSREVRASSPASPPPPPTVEVKVKAYPVLWNTAS